MIAAFDLSVVMGVYNGGVEIPATLHSLFGQEGVAFEIVVDTAAPKFQHFARELFHEARRCGAAARTVSKARDLRLYERMARIVGWTTAARIATRLRR